MQQIPENSLTNSEEVYASFKRLLDEVAHENMRNGPGDARSRVDLYVAVHAALSNSRGFTTRAWNPPPSRIRPPGAPVPEGYRPPEPWRQMDPSLHSRLIKTCFPKLEAIEARVTKRLEATRIAAEEARHEAERRDQEEEQRRIEEQNRQREEHERKMELDRRELARRLEEQARRAQEKRIEAAKPVNRLKVLYANYKYLKVCYAVRLGYLAVWINDVEMERTKAAVSAIEKQLLSEDGSLNTNDVWNAIPEPRNVHEYVCRQTYNQVLSLAPAAPMRKDFGR
jgi:hypothetical protein